MQLPLKASFALATMLLTTAMFTGIATPAMASAQTTNANVATNVAANVASGAALYASNCASCHMANGAGGKKFGSAISANLRAPGLEKTYHNSDALILRAIMNDRDEDGETLDKPMLAWKGILTNAQGKDIIAYLRTLHS
ncbi:MAG: c-type cytochrome [Acidocella sp.]|nr:c-type cytochrome [Acidocella sp.]